MNQLLTSGGCLLVSVASCLMAQGAEPGGRTPDPVQAITRSFPGSVEVKERGRVLEFCPDNTCDGFTASADVSVPTLKDFAYLYVYFFSDYYVLRK